MSLVYSKRLLAAGVAPATPVTVTVPSGVTWVVRSIHVTATSTGSSSWGIQVVGLSLIAGGGPIPGPGAVFVECRQVVNAGEQLQAFSGGVTLYFYVSGYQLQGVPP